MQPIEVDGMLYVALRNRGVDKIRNADLEGGTYDLALAERFGPLDAEARNYRTWSEMYVTGASFWEVDWGRAVEYFEQLILTAPYLMDGSGWTSTDRYRISLAKYGDFLAEQGLYCEAYERYQASREIREDPALEPTATFMYDQCYAPPEPEPVEETPTPTPTLEGEVVPTLESTPVPTLESTPNPTEEATQAPPLAKNPPRRRKDEHPYLGLNPGLLVPYARYGGLDRRAIHAGAVHPTHGPAQAGPGCL
jgi:hypothetical protein